MEMMKRPTSSQFDRQVSELMLVTHFVFSNKMPLVMLAKDGIQTQ